MFRRFSEGERHPRLFGRGDIKYVILDHLKDNPGHGYEIIRALEERFHGMYTPSAGSVYPTLQMLEEMEYVSAREMDGKKVYSVTEKGLGFLEEHADSMRRISDHIKRWRGEMGRGDIHNILHDLRAMARIIGRRSRDLSREQLRQAAEAVSRTYREIEKIVEEEP